MIEKIVRVQGAHAWPLVGIKVKHFIMFIVSNQTSQWLTDITWYIISWLLLWLIIN